MEYIRRHKMHTRVSREVCVRETGRAPIKTGWGRLVRGSQESPNLFARWVTKECKTHAIPDFSASTPPEEALKVVLGIATGERRRKVVAVVHVRKTYFYLELPLEDYQLNDVCGPLRHSLDRHMRRCTELRRGIHVHFEQFERLCST